MKEVQSVQQSNERRLSDGSKAPALPRWFLWVLAGVVTALGAVVVWVLSTFAGFIYEIWL